jgi:hypothetical protein
VQVESGATSGMVTDDPETFRLDNLESDVGRRVASVRLSWLETARFPECMYIQDILRGVMERIA